MILNNTTHSRACLTLENKMKIKIELEVDTENQADRIKIEQVLYQLQQVKEILEKLDQNLNKGGRRNRQ